jgi:hypothetical protein
LAIASLVVSVLAAVAAIVSGVVAWNTYRLAKGEPQFLLHSVDRPSGEITIYQSGSATFSATTVSLSCEYEDPEGHITPTAPQAFTVAKDQSSESGATIYKVSGLTQLVVDSGCNAGHVVRILVHAVGEKDWMEVITWREPTN